MDKKTKRRYDTEQLAATFEEMDKILESISENLKQLEENFCHYPEEVCPDEEVADQAAMEAIRELCLESLLEIPPKGDLEGCDPPLQGRVRKGGTEETPRAASGRYWI